MDISAQQKQLIAETARHHGLRLVILHGSQATRHTRLGSDYDIAVRAAHHLSFGQRFEIQEALAPVFSIGSDDIDLVDLRTASPLLTHRISRHGIVLYGTSREAEQFHLSAITGYIDARRIFDATEEYVKTYGSR